MVPDYVKEVRSWIESFVIGLNLCPFAKTPFKSESITYAIVELENEEIFFSRFKQELEDLNESDISTAILIIPDKSMEFRDYLDLYGKCESLLIDLHLSEEFQLASFHPEYQFADADKADLSNYTNRSPYPLIHILRVDELTKAIESYGDTSKIYERNIELLTSMTKEDIDRYYTGYE